MVTDYTDRKVISRLKVAMVTFGNAGTYTCTYASIKPDSVRLSVLECKPLFRCYTNFVALGEILKQIAF